MSKILIFTSLFLMVMTLNLKLSQAKQKAKVKNQILEFKELDILGEKAKPDLIQFGHNKQRNFKKLIKLRDDFKPEMRKDFGKM